jgi:hypothetical protein
MTFQKLLLAAIVLILSMVSIDGCTCVGNKPYANYVNIYPKKVKETTTYSVIEQPSSVMNRMNKWIKKNNVSTCKIESLQSPIQMDADLNSEIYKMPNYYVVRTVKLSFGSPIENYVSYFEFFRIWYCSSTLANYDYNPNNFEDYAGTWVPHIRASSANTKYSNSILYLGIAIFCMIMIALN